MVANRSRLGLLLGMALSLFSAGAEEVEVVQPRFVLAIRGQNVSLACSVSNENLPGPVRWFMGRGPTRKLIYSSMEPSARVTRTSPDSDSDFSICIHNFAPEDAGVYYCVKRRSINGGEEDWQSGGGTKVSETETELQEQGETPGSDIPRDQDPRDDVLPAVAGTVCALLAVLISVALCIYVKKKRGEKGHSTRSEGPTSESPGTPPQAPPDKEVVYVDVQHPSGGPRPQRSRPEEHATYATIR